MDWNKLITTRRLGLENYNSSHEDVRSEFERDYDRLIFSAPFRRLQNKTQVFPLPGSIFVHNRLTHSLEVSTVGRSLGCKVAHALRQRHKDDALMFSAVPEIVQAACLAHDLGNPPFGHSGELAIATYFSEGKGMPLRQQMSAAEWADLTHFDGNANAFRMLTHKFVGRRDGGFALTYPTLASIVKYPYEARYCPKGKQKFGFFQQDKELYERISDYLGISRDPSYSDFYARHPLVYLVEAADDICYQMMDLEDACKLHIVSFEEAQHLYLGFISAERRDRCMQHCAQLADTNEQLAYLRTCAIGALVDGCTEAFLSSEETMLRGESVKTLIKQLPEPLNAPYQACAKTAVEKIYRSRIVLDIELAGYKVISALLEHYVDAVMHPGHAYSARLLDRVPSQYDVRAEDTYSRILAVLDFISGMTDVYALDLYRMIQGIDIPKL
ncbi:MAG: dNTP triphosphohydrolase [Paludibacteraceae bacterium]|nr:dNTP triphosphohydrolase [Paludibacteraceae bacterium]